jgi:hypothetical protein
MYLTLGEVTSRTVKLENVGNTALFYKWERRPLESMGVTTPRRTLGWLPLDLSPPVFEAVLCSALFQIFMVLPYVHNLHYFSSYEEQLEFRNCSVCRVTSTVLIMKSGFA